MSKTTVRTVGRADLQEEVTFVTAVKLSEGDVVSLKTQIPIVSPVYGAARVTRYVGPGRDQAHRKYAAIRIS